METAIINASVCSIGEAGRVARQVAAWLEVRGGKAAVVAISDPRSVAAELAGADAVIIVNADGQDFCNASLLEVLGALQAGALAGKPVLPVVRRSAREWGAVDGTLGPVLQGLGAALVLNPVALEHWDFQFPEGEYLRLVEGLLALAKAVGFCRRLEQERQSLAENLALAAGFACAPLLA